MTGTRVDRAALVRRAMVELVAETGIQGATMGEVAKRAGVATGTAYVHYQSKQDLLIAAFIEGKQALGTGVTAGLDYTSLPRQIFETVWRRTYNHLRSDPALARFLTRIDESPLRQRAHDALADDDPLTRLAADMAPHLIALPIEIIYELGLAPAVRLAAWGVPLDDRGIDLVVASCWRAVTPGDAED
jgi:AcrR family transcriptional regulator